MTWRKRTGYFIVAMIALICIYDVVAFKVSGVDATISRIILGWSTKIPMLNVAIGVLVGHWAWGQPLPKP